MELRPDAMAGEIFGGVGRGEGVFARFLHGHHIYFCGMLEQRHGQTERGRRFARSFPGDERPARDHHAPRVLRHGEDRRAAAHRQIGGEMQWIAHFSPGASGQRHDH